MDVMSQCFCIRHRSAQQRSLPSRQLEMLSRSCLSEAQTFTTRTATLSMRQRMTWPSRHSVTGNVSDKSKIKKGQEQRNERHQTRPILTVNHVVELGVVLDRSKAATSYTLMVSGTYCEVMRAFVDTDHSYVVCFHSHVLSHSLQHQFTSCLDLSPF